MSEPHRFSIMFHPYKKPIDKEVWWEDLKNLYGFENKPLHEYPLPPYPRKHFIDRNPDFPLRGTAEFDIRPWDLEKIPKLNI